MLTTMKTVPLVLLLAACAPTVYSKPGASNEEFERTAARCRVAGAMVPQPAPSNDPGDGLFHAAIAGKTIENCMRAEGFVKR